MICNNCGFESDNDILVCPVCGARSTQATSYEDEGTTILSRNQESVMIEEDDDEGTTVLSRSVPREKAQVLTADQLTDRPDFLMHEEPIKLNNLKKPEKKSKPLVKAAIIFLVLLVVAGIGVLLWIFVPKFSKYSEAEELLSDGKVENAITLYTELAGFRGSDEMVNGGAYYTYANDLYDDEDYKNAANYYSQAAAFSYKDAEELCRESYYRYGEALREVDEYDDAASAFAAAGTYEDAAERELECYYAKAEASYEAGDYDGAVAAYLKAGDYSDSTEKIAICYYYEAEAYKDDQDYLNAYDYYIKSAYDDYMSEANDCLYKYAQSAFNDEKYELAITNYEKIDTAYMDVTDELDDCYIALAKQAEAAGTYPTAIENYENVVNTDMSAYINQDKMKYIDAHYDSRDELTMGYLCDLKYCGVNNDYDTSYKEEALNKYHELSGWTINSYINSAADDYDTRESYAPVSGTTYVHTYYTNDEGYELDLYGYIVYSNNTTSNTVTFNTIGSNATTWISVNAAEDVEGEAVLYIYEADQNKLVEKYTFTIR